MPLDATGKETGWISKWAFQKDALKADAVGREAVEAGALTPTMMQYPASGGMANLLVAGSDASAAIQARADYVCDGVNDEVQIAAALAALPTNNDWWHTAGGCVKLIGTFHIGAADVILIEASHQWLDASQAVLLVDVAGAGNLISVIRPAADQQLTNVRVIIGAVANGAIGIADFTGNVIYLKGCKSSQLAILSSGSMDAATMINADTLAAGAYNNEQNEYFVRCLSKYGIQFSGDGSNYYARVPYFSFNPSDIAGSIGIRNTGSAMSPLAIGYCVMWVLNTAIGIQLANITKCVIDQLNYEIATATATVIEGDATNTSIVISTAEGFNLGAGTVFSRNGSAKYTVLSDKTTYQYKKYIRVGEVGGSGTTVMTAARVYLFPVEIDRDVTIDKILLYSAAVVGGGHITVGLYADNGNTPAGGALIVQSASIANQGAAFSAEYTIADSLVPAGLYWIAVEADDANTLRTVGNRLDTNILGAQQYDLGGGYGALTDPCPAVAAGVDFAAGIRVKA